MRAAWKKMFVLWLLLSPLVEGATGQQGWQLMDRFKDVSVGEWVKLRYSGGSEHLLLVAAKDGNAITLEEKVREDDYLTSWTQIVIDLKKRLPVAVRERIPGGEIRETKIEGQKSSLDEDFYALLTARFREEPEKERVIVPAGTFPCTVYRAVYNKRLIRIFLSDRIPLYPVKVLIPSYELTISLVAFGKGMESRFLPEEKGRIGGPEGTKRLEEVSPGGRGSSEAGCNPKIE